MHYFQYKTIFDKILLIKNCYEIQYYIENVRMLSLF